jgi:hypothetical protein
MRNSLGQRLKWSVLLLGISGFPFGCCSESTRAVTIAGTVSYDGFQAGEIRLMLSEDVSTRCSGG